MDATDQSLVDYDSMNPGSFGGCVLGDAYELYAHATQGTLVTTVSYAALGDGVPNSGVMTDAWVALPGNQLDPKGLGGWHLVGQPFAHNTYIGDLAFTDGNNYYTWARPPAMPPEVPVRLGLTPICGGGLYQRKMFDVGIAMDFDDHLRAGQGYEFHTDINNIAMIIPSTPD